MRQKSEGNGAGVLQETPNLRHLPPQLDCTRYNTVVAILEGIPQILPDIGGHFEERSDDLGIELAS